MGPLTQGSLSAESMQSQKDAEWKRKQRLREDHIAPHREKCLRKSDGKKQRKIKNPVHHNKNVERNSMGDVLLERRTIWQNAIKQAERLAAIHDPSGRSFNVGAVTTLPDGQVVNIQALAKRKETKAAKESASLQDEKELTNDKPQDVGRPPSESQILIPDGMNPARFAILARSYGMNAQSDSKTQPRKLEPLIPAPAPPKPVIPDGLSIPEGEENWLALWDLSDHGIERRVLKEKKRKAAEEKAFRTQEQAGKVHRRAARDEERKVYRTFKEERKSIKSLEREHKRKIERLEQEETRKIAVAINKAERKRAMERCAELGFTLENTEGLEEIKPKVLGMKGKEANFSVLRKGKTHLELKVIANGGSRSNSRADLGSTMHKSRVKLLTAQERSRPDTRTDIISLDNAEAGEDFEALNHNHKLQRKVHSALRHAEQEKEAVVRKRAREHCEKSNIPIPEELETPLKVQKMAGKRILEDGTIETEKQKRGRDKVDLAEVSRFSKVLKAQAKERAMKAGLEVVASLTKGSGDEAMASAQRKEILGADEGSNFRSLEKSSSEPAQNGSASDSDSDSDASSIHRKRGLQSIEADHAYENARPEKRARKLRLGNAQPTTNGGAKKGDTRKWHADALEGDVRRKDKFLRLLGAGKSAGSGASTQALHDGHDESAAISRRNAELERQFDAGLQMKNGGTKRGLGLM